MKKIFVAAFCMLLCFNTITAFASDNKPGTEKMTEERYTEMKQRVEEIKKMDKSSLSRVERKELRTELKNMNKEARARGGSGIYISVGALVVIIIVLLLLL